MRTLAIDASIYRGSAAVIQNGSVLASARVAMRAADAERLMPAVARVLDEAGTDVAALDAVACGSGPGSFTSLRIAASIAKGIALGAAKPLFAIPSLLLVAAAGAGDRPGRYLPWLDALRGELYVACYEHMTGEITAGDARARNGQWSELRAAAVTPRQGLESLASTLGALPVSAAAGEPPPNAPDTRPAGTVFAPGGIAAGVASLEGWLATADPVSLGAWEPDYGRPPEAQVRWEEAHGRALTAS